MCGDFVGAEKWNPVCTVGDYSSPHQGNGGNSGGAAPGCGDGLFHLLVLKQIFLKTITPGHLRKSVPVFCYSM